MLHRFVLPVRGGDDVRMTMSDADGHDAAESVEVALAHLVPDVLHAAFNQHDRFFVVEENAWVHELLALGENFLSGGTGIFLRLMTGWRQRDILHINGAYSSRKRAFAQVRSECRMCDGEAA